MKTCLLILTCIFTFAFLPATKQKAQTYFYFCVSRSASDNNNNAAIKQTVLYSGIHQIIGEETLFKKKTKDWQDLVDASCASKTGCTGDLNYYSTREEAKTAYAKTLDSFSDTTKFILKKVKFQ